jgi:hypothetical protein
MENEMKKIMMSTIVMLAMLLSLGGCFFPGPWHHRDGGHDRGGGHGKGGYEHHWDGGRDYGRDGTHYERR